MAGEAIKGSRRVLCAAGYGDRVHRTRTPRGDRSALVHGLLAAGVVLVGAAACTPEPSPSRSPTLADPATYAEQIVAATNDVRRVEGLDQLRPAPCATEVALDRATDLVTADELEHAPLDDVFEACVGYSRAAENLVNSQAAPSEVVEAWMASPGHRLNILDPGLIGIAVGCTASDTGLLCSQIFLGHG